MGLNEYSQIFILDQNQDQNSLQTHLSNASVTM